MTLELESQPIRFPDDSGRTLGEILAGAAPNSVIELSPGRYVGPLSITRPLTLKGAGDLTRIAGDGGTVITVRASGAAPTILESLLLEDGGGESGGGLLILEGLVRAHNIHIRRCHSKTSAGAIHIAGGELQASRLRAHEVSGDRGGAIRASGGAIVSLRDSQIRRSEARLGGALAVEDQARVQVEGMTIARSRARTSSGGQAIYVAGSGSAFPVLRLKRVRLEDAPMGMPLVVDPAHPGEVRVSECDMPRVVLGAPGVIDAGDNHWR